MAILTLAQQDFVDVCAGLDTVSKRKKQWLSLIAADKLTCSATGIKVDHVEYQLNKHWNGRSSYHYNFYSLGGDFMTVDHIIPKSRGGSVMDIDNLQPMRDRENFAKGSKI